MYTIYVDGELLFSSGLDDERFIILSPKLSMDVNGAGSLTFVIPPRNSLYDSIKKIKSIITVKQDDEVIFRGRVLDDEKDFYNQKNVYCEGERSFLLDSLKKPYDHSEGVNVLQFFKDLIQNHNEQVEEEKRFTIGTVTAIDETVTMEAKDDGYNDTLCVIEDRLLGAYGGYLRMRTAGDVHYIDWLQDAGDTNGQAIEFSVNLLDLNDKVDAADVFTVLIPLGKSELDGDGGYKEPVNITSVNDGCEYLENQAAIDLYGRIWRTQTWVYEDNPQKLKEKGLEYLKKGVSVQTLTLNAVDMHFLDSDVQRIWIGDHVRILSDPHGLDITIICSKMDIDLLNPEKTTYTFGEPPRTLTENFVETEEDVSIMTGSRGGGGRGRKEAGDVKRWAEIKVDAENAKITALAWDNNEIAGHVATIRSDLDATSATVSTVINKTIKEIDGRIEEAESSITQQADQISMKVSKNGVISAINQSAEEVTIEAGKINLSGYVTFDDMADMQAAIADTFITNQLVVGDYASFEGKIYATGGISVESDTAHWLSKTVVTGTKNRQGFAVTLRDGSNAIIYGFSDDSYVNTTTIYYLGKEKE